MAENGTGPSPVAEAVVSPTVVVGLPVAVGPPGPRGPEGPGGVTPEDLEEHISGEAPHPAYDDIPSLAIIFENGLV